MADTKSNSGLKKPLNLSPELQEIVGAGPMPRTEVVRLLWEYIRSNNLQDSQNRTLINTDAKLKKIFDGENQVHMLKIAKYISKHVSSVEDSARAA